MVSSTTGSGVDRDLKDVTTSSIEAYRYYAEGINLHERFREDEAVPLLAKSVEIDPGFAMALSKLSIIHGNLGHPARRDEYGARAMEHVDRLTARERYYVEGNFYANNGATFTNAIEAFKRAIELYPDHASARNNLALVYMRVERFDDAVREYEQLRQRGMTFPGTYGALADAYASMGQFERGLQVVTEFVGRNADNAPGFTILGNLLARGGKWDEAMAAYVKAAALDPANLGPQNGRRALHVLRQQWAEAEAIDRRLLESPDPFWRFVANMNRGYEQLYKGRSAAALKMFDAAARESGSRGSNQSAGARTAMARILLDKGQAADALVLARRARDDVDGRGPQTQVSLELMAVASQQLGREAEATQAAADLARRLDQLPGSALKRFNHLTAGRRALVRHDTARVIEELKQAESMLPPSPGGAGQTEGGQGVVDIWFHLGSAYLAAGNDSEAARRFQRIVDVGPTRLTAPMEYVRSLYLLGQIHDRRGDRPKAADFYRKFLQYWADGDLDRERVADAQKKLAS